MSLEGNKSIVRKMVKAMNERNLDLLEEWVAPDYVDHTHHLQGPQEVKKFLTMCFKGLDLHFSIEDMVAEGDKVWVRMLFTATHVGDFMGFTATGKKSTETAVQMYRIVKGKIVDNIQVSNPLDLLIQLGAVEYTEKAKKRLPESTAKPL